MEYARFGKDIVVRIDKDEEIMEQLKAVAEKEKIVLASVHALGAIKDFTVGVFHPDEKKYYANRFTGAFEIVSLHGTISTMNGSYYPHIHMSAGDEKGKVYGGHLNEAVVGATCEMVIHLMDGRVEREYSEEIGLNLFRFI